MDPNLGLLLQPSLNFAEFGAPGVMIILVVLYTLKCIAHEICECLTLIINQSIRTGIFPENLKIAKVVPIYKKETQIKNYRPISVLHVYSKIFKNIRKCNAQPIDGIFYIT